MRSSLLVVLIWLSCVTPKKGVNSWQDFPDVESHLLSGGTTSQAESLAQAYLKRAALRLAEKQTTRSALNDINQAKRLGAAAPRSLRNSAVAAARIWDLRRAAGRDYSAGHFGSITLTELWRIGAKRQAFQKMRAEGLWHHSLAPQIESWWEGAGLQVNREDLRCIADRSWTHACVESLKVAPLWQLILVARVARVESWPSHEVQFSLALVESMQDFGHPFYWNAYWQGNSNEAHPIGKKFRELTAGTFQMGEFLWPELQPAFARSFSCLYAGECVASVGAGTEGWYGGSRALAGCISSVWRGGTCAALALHRENPDDPRFLAFEAARIARKKPEHAKQLLLHGAAASGDPGPYLSRGCFSALRVGADLLAVSLAKEALAHLPAGGQVAAANCAVQGLTKLGRRKSAKSLEAYYNVWGMTSTAAAELMDFVVGWPYGIQVWCEQTNHRACEV